MALSRTSTAINYLAHIKTSRIKSRKTSIPYYKKFKEIIICRRQNIFSGPSNQTAERLMKSLHIKFLRKKPIIDEILAALEKLPCWKTKSRNSQKHTACKLASTKLVKYCLQTRKSAVSKILRIKKDVMDSTFEGIEHFGECFHTVSTEP